MTKLLILPFLFLLASCGPQTGADGYSFGKKQYTQTDLRVDVVVYETKEKFMAEVRRRNLVADGNEIAAFTVLYLDDRSRCTIHIIDPEADYSPEFVGHEFLHCVYGQWHSSNQSRE
jgi:hypothetical protein